VETLSQTHSAPLATDAPPRPGTAAASAPCTEVCPQFHEAIELRFGELGKVVPGLSDRLLSQRLRELEDEGLVERQVEAGTPVRVTYSLTPTGEDLGPAISELKAWAKRWKATS
jgi:DNA-binding transcriptional ArsR family regulator